MALVHIVYAVDKTGMNPDLDRMGTVEEMPDELARMWLADGTGREPTEDERAGFEQQQAATADATRGDLEKLLKADLEAKAAELGVTVPDKATKADLVAALEEHLAQQADTTTTEPGSVSQPPVVTTMAGAGGATASDPGSPSAPTA